MSAQTADPTQVLDRVEVFNTGKVSRLRFEAPLGVTALKTTPLPNTAGYRSCQFSPAKGLFCLDGAIVRNWPNPQTDPPPAGQAPVEIVKNLFSCGDAALALDKKSDACTSMTVDLAGNIWLAGRKSNNLHNLIKITEKKNNACTEGNPLTGLGSAAANGDLQFSSYCYSVYRTGRPLLLDISPVDGDLAAAFYGKGILGVEERKTVVFYPNDLTQPVITLGSGKSDWSLVGNEQVHSAALYQVPFDPRTDDTDPANDTQPAVVDNFGLITTSTGRVLWRDLSNLNKPAVLLTDLKAYQGATACTTTGSQFFDLRASNVTSRLFGSNRNFCQVSGFRPFYVYAPPGSSTGPALTMSTATTTATVTTISTGTDTVDGIAVSPGISIDLATCRSIDGCTLINDSELDPNAYKAARLYDVSVVSNATGMVLFQVKNIPDCRYFPAGVAPCDKPGLVYPVGAAPQQQWLNVAPLMPQDIRDLFDASGKRPTGLPKLWLSPRYRAQKDANGNRYFEALFGRTEAGVQFRKTFTIELDVGDPNLLGDSLGCGVTQTDMNGAPAPLPFNQWDIITTVSERYTNVGGPTDQVTDSPTADAEHADMLLNTNCVNPTSGSGTRWSMYSYGLELAENVAPTTAGGPWTFSPAKNYLGEMLKSLHSDLQDMQSRLACQNVDYVGDTTTLPTSPPLSSSTCSSLSSSLTGTADKLNKCVAATYDPKTSAIDQNCNAFTTQFSNYRQTLNGLTPFGTDPANRVGELIARSNVIWYIYNEHFLKAFSLGDAANAAP